MVACFFGVAFLPFLLAPCVGDAAEALRFVPEFASFAGEDERFSDDLEAPRRAEERVAGMMVDRGRGGDVVTGWCGGNAEGLECECCYMYYKLKSKVVVYKVQEEEELGNAEK
jgi:hypothetical protein